MIDRDTPVPEEYLVRGYSRILCSDAEYKGVIKNTKWLKFVIAIKRDDGGWLVIHKWRNLTLFP